MKPSHWIKSHQRELLIIGINLLVLFGAIAAFEINHKIEILLSIVGVCISINIAVSNYQIENDKIFKELFTEFNEKYDDKYNDFLNRIDSQQNELISPADRCIIIDYLNFCAEEYMWYKKGRISVEVWNSWEVGMTYFLRNNPSISKIVQEEKKSQSASYYGFFDYLKL